MKIYDTIIIPAQQSSQKEEIHERFVCLTPTIVITEEDLLNLMQEAIEHSYPTLLRTKAIELLHSKLE